MRAPISGRLRYIEIRGGNLAGGSLLDRFERREARRLATGSKTTDAGDGKPDITGKFGPGDTFAGKPCFKPHAEYLHHKQERRNSILTCHGVDESVGFLHVAQMPRQSDIANLPNSIAFYREARRLSQERLGGLIGKTGATVSRAEHGNFTSKVLEAIATALGVPSSELLEKPGDATQMALRLAARGFKGDLAALALGLLQTLQNTKAA